MKTNYGLDWIRFTIPYHTSIKDVFPYGWADQDYDAKTLTAYPSYSMARKLRVGREDWNPARKTQRRMITFTGDDLRALRDQYGMSDQLLIRLIVTTPDAHITRLDYAVDIAEEPLRAASFYVDWQAGRIKTPARTVKLVQTYSPTDASDPATTVYFGSRSSNKMVRVYDKGKQQNVPFDWLRVEVEVKGDMAQKVARAMNRVGSVTEVGNQTISDMLDYPEEWLRRVLAYECEVDLTLGRKQTDWERWVREVVIPNFDKAIKSDAGGARAALRAMCYEYKHLCE